MANNKIQNYWTKNIESYRIESNSSTMALIIQLRIQWSCCYFFFLIFNSSFCVLLRPIHFIVISIFKNIMVTLHSGKQIHWNSVRANNKLYIAEGSR